MFDLQAEIIPAAGRKNQKLNEYVERREMERVPRIKGCFRPTKGNFGRE